MGLFSIKGSGFNHVTNTFLTMHVPSSTLADISEVYHDHILLVVQYHYSRNGKSKEKNIECHGGLYIEGSQPEWSILSMIYSRDTPF